MLINIAREGVVAELFIGEGGRMQLFGILMMTFVIFFTGFKVATGSQDEVNIFDDHQAAQVEIEAPTSTDSIEAETEEG